MMNLTPPGTLLLGVVGSTAHGLARKGSDVDLLGAFAAPTLDIAGLDWHSNKESIVNHDPDLTFHEAGKYLRLVLKGNPTALELLFLDTYHIKTDLGAELVNLRTSLINPRSAKDAYCGYAKSQIARFERNAINDKVEHKTARHTLRLVEQGLKLLTEGVFSIRVEDPQRYFDLDEMEYYDVVEYLTKELITLYDTPVDITPLNFDRRAAERWLREVRQSFL